MYMYVYKDFVSDGSMGIRYDLRTRYVTCILHLVNDSEVCHLETRAGEENRKMCTCMYFSCDFYNSYSHFNEFNECKHVYVNLHFSQSLFL